MGQSMLPAGHHVPSISSGPYPLRHGNRVRPLVDGEPAFRRICEAVEAASDSVWVTVAFMSRDFAMPDGRGSLFDVLDAAVARGLDVRVIFWRHTLLEQIKPGTHYSGTEPERQALADRGSRFHAVWDQADGNYCQHQKSWLVDAGTEGEIAFVGGINLGQDSTVPVGHPATDGGNVHDVYLELQGPSGTDVHHNFVQRWNGASDRQQPDGRFPADVEPGLLAFPTRPSEPRGEVPVQIQRTVRAGRYTDDTATPGGEPFAIERGDKTILAQYLAALQAAKHTIYVEDQAIGYAPVVDALHDALRRGVQVVFLVPAEPNQDMVKARTDPKAKAFFDSLTALDDHAHFTLVGIASPREDGELQNIYVHAKIALVDDHWCTVGSTNIAARSFHGDTELNASFWCTKAVRAFRVELLAEHLGRDTSDLDDRGALSLYAEIARDNAARRARGDALSGLAFALEASTYGA